MRSACPHSHEPQPHETDFAENGPPVQSCTRCGGLVRRCEHCDTLNRYAARHCRSCGRALVPIPPDGGVLVSPGEIRRRLADALEGVLRDAFPIPSDARPVHWLAVADGIFLFAEQSHLGQSHVFHVPATALPDLKAVALADARPLPATDHWISEPVAGVHGLFLLAGEALHYFPAHGDTRYLVQRTWHPPAGWRPEALCLKGDGQVAIVASPTGSQTDSQTGSGNAPVAGPLLFDGNTQIGDWTPVALPDLDLPLQSGCGYAAGDAHGAFGADIWVYTGGELVFLSLGPAPAQKKRIPIDQGLAPPRLLKDRAAKGVFQPFVMTSGTGIRQFVFPKQGRNGGAAAIGVLDLVGKGDRNWGELTVGDWLRPDPWGEGLLVRREGGLAHLVSGNAVWEEGGSFSALAPALARYWMLAARLDAAGDRLTLGQRLHLSLFALARDAEGVRIDAYTTHRTGYSPVPGLPPLAIDGWLLYAGDDGDGSPRFALARIAE